MNFRDFLEQIGESSNHGNRGVVPERGHAPSSVLTDIVKDQRGFNYNFLPNESQLITVDELRKRTNKANDKATLIEDFGRLSVLLEQRAAKGKFDISLNKCYFKANLDSVIRELTMRGFRVQVSDGEIKLIWCTGDNNRD